MGCEVSKVEANDDIAPLRLLPFRRRIDDIRQRRNGRTVINDGTLSSKQLLHDEGEDGPTCPTDDAPDSEIRKSMSSPPDSETSVWWRKGQSTPIKDATETETGNDDSEKKKTPDSEKKSKTTVVPAEEETEGDMEKDNGEGKDEEHHGEKEQDDGTGTGTGSGSGCGRDEDDDEGEGGSLDGDGREIAPGSPSFREFFVSLASNAADTDSGDAGDGEDTSGGLKTEDKPLRRKESSSSDSSEELVDKSAKKENKGRRFRNVLSKKNQGGVKNFLNIRSCYYPSSSSTSTSSSVHGKVSA